MSKFNQKLILQSGRIFLLATISIFIVACDDKNSGGIEKQPIKVSSVLSEHGKILIHVTTAKRIELNETVFASGTIAAKRTSNIGPLVEGVIEEIFVKVGGRVKQGDPLFKTRQDNYQRRLEEAKAALNLAEIRSVQSHRNFKNARELARNRNISKTRLDDIETAYQISNAVVDQSEAAFKTAKQYYADTVVTAPFDGSITSKNVDEGVYLSNRFSMGGASAVVRIQEISVVAAIVQTPEKNLGLLSLGQSATITVEGHNKKFDSYIYILNDRVDPQTRTVEMRLPIANENYAIKPGQFVQAKILLPSRAVIAIDRKALVQINSITSVFVLKDSIVRLIPINIRSISPDKVEVIEGLREGDMVILNPNDAQRDGSKVSMENVNVVS